MRYLRARTAVPASRIRLGTWQSGSRERGYGPSYAGQEARAIVRRAVEFSLGICAARAWTWPDLRGGTVREYP